MNIFLISDSHFGHAKIAKYCNRPDNFEDLIYHNWNSTVRNSDDTVIHLGDLMLTNRENQRKFDFHSLMGVKILVRGNHDRESREYYVKKGFNVICNYINMGDILYTHLPVTIPEHIRYNIHGHYHIKHFAIGHVDYKSKTVLTEKHLLFSIEDMRYMPVEVNRFINVMMKRRREGSIKYEEEEGYEEATNEQ